MGSTIGKKTLFLVIRIKMSDYGYLDLYVLYEKLDERLQ